MTPREVGIAVAKRGVVALVVALVVVAGAWTLPMLTQSPTERQPLDTPEYAPSAVAATPIPAAGEIQPDTSVGNQAGLVVIDDDHSNRFSRTELSPMVQALTDAGYKVRFHEGDQSLDQELSNANAYVVIDPGSEYDADELENVRQFTNDGGHLLLVGEPNRKRISASLFGTSISDTESALTTLAGRYDMSIGTSYLYNLETNGGNYKHVTVRPTPESGLEFEQATMFTAAPLSSRGGTVILRAADNTFEAGNDEPARHAVAIHKRNEGVLLLGDKTFLDASHHNVGENEEFGAFVVEFLLSGEAPSGLEDEEEEPEPTDGDGEGTPAPGDGETTPAGEGNETTPTPPTPEAERLVAPA